MGCADVAAASSTTWFRFLSCAVPAIKTPRFLSWKPSSSVLVATRAPRQGRKSRLWQCESPVIIVGGSVLVSLPVGLLMCLILTVVALLVWRVPVHPTDAERSDHLDDIPD